MKLFRTFALFISFFCLTNLSLQAQTTNNQQIKTTIYYYNFSGELSQTKLNQIEAEAKTLTNVDEVKIKYKEESELGQLIVIVKEKSRNSEGDNLFQPTDLKKLLSNNNLIPNELTLELLKN